MEKIISIKGKVAEKGTVAYKLSVMAAIDGKNLKYYIETLLTNHVK